MISILSSEHRIDIDTFPAQVIFYDGKEISKKSSLTGSSTHDFKVIENDGETIYEVTFGSLLVDTLIKSTCREFGIRRNGKRIFRFKDLGFMAVYNGHSIELKNVLGLMGKIVVLYDGNEICRKNIILMIGTHEFSFTVMENNENVEYEVEYTLLTKFKTDFKIRRNGVLILIYDSSMTADNASRTVLGGAKVAGTFTGAAAAMYTGGGGAAARGVNQSATVLKNAPEMIKSAERIAKVIGSLKNDKS